MVQTNRESPWICEVGIPNLIKGYDDWTIMFYYVLFNYAILVVISCIQLWYKTKFMAHDDLLSFTRNVLKY